MSVLRAACGVRARVWTSGMWPAAFVASIAIVGLAASNGGFFPRSWSIASVGLFGAVALAVLLGFELELGRLDLVWLGFLVAVFVWTALSISWSPHPGDSLHELRRGLVYLGGLAAVLLLTPRRFAAWLVAVVWGAVAFVVVYALLVYLLRPQARFDVVEGALLSKPLGYANAVGILAGIGAVLGAGLTVRGESRFVQRLAAASVAPLGAALYLSSSRASVLALAVGLVAMVAFDRERVDLVGALCVLAPAAALAAFLGERSRLIDETTVGAQADRAGRLLALWIVLLASALVAAPQAARWVGGALVRLRWLRRALALVVGAAVVGIAVGLAVHGIDEGYRPDYWHVAWIEYLAHPWLGSGAGTFAGYWLHYGIPGVAGGALDAHNLYLETLAELGPIGVLLTIAMLGVPLVAAFRVRGQAFVPVALGGYVTLLGHAALDWDWELPAVLLAGLLCAAATVVAARETTGAEARAARPGGSARCRARACDLRARRATRLMRARGGPGGRPLAIAADCVYLL